MYNIIKNLFNKIALTYKTKYIDNYSEIIFGKNVIINIHKSSTVQLNGKLLIGIPTTGAREIFSTYPNTILTIGKNSSLIIDGDVQISKGCSIIIGENANMYFGGKNIIAHNTILYIKHRMELHSGASCSWNCCLIDNDGHNYIKTSGVAIKRKIMPLIIHKNVGIQMNVNIPSGVEIGENSIIAANTVLRKNIPPNTIAYNAVEYKIKENFTTGFQFE